MVIGIMLGSCAADHVGIILESLWDADRLGIIAGGHELLFVVDFARQLERFNEL